jgi:hypothetical protein
MSSKGNRRIKFGLDRHEEEKRALFIRLNELAWARNVAVIHAWVRMTDYVAGVWDDILFQSNGPDAKPNVCVFCGQGGLNPENAWELGKFLADDECFRNHFVDLQGTCFLEPKDYRPTVILVLSYLPGSVENMIWELAWGIGIHDSQLKCPSAPPKAREKAAWIYARKLVRSLTEEDQLRRVI